MVDAVETAAAWGLLLDGPTRAEPGALQAELADPQADLPPVPQLVLEHWLPVAQFLNAMNRSLGERDALDFAPRPRWPLDETAPKLIGAGVKA